MVNIVGSTIGLGQVGAGARFMRMGKALMVLGLGADGMGVLVAGAQFVEQLESIDPSMPDGMRRVMVMKLVGQQLASLGMQVGGTLVARSAALRRAARKGRPITTTDAQKKVSVEIFQTEFHGRSRQLQKAARRKAWSETTDGRVQAAYDRKRRQLAGDVGATKMGRLPDDKLVSALTRRARELRMGSEIAAVYHAQKHHKELPKGEKRRGGQMTSYLRSARDTIAHADSKDVTMMQDGSRSVSFVRKVAGTEVRAIVHVSRSGDAVIATYGGF